MIIVTPHTRGAGYFLNNQGLGARERQEADIATCTHCETVIILQKWKENGGWCGRCMAPICGPCADRMLTHGCEPFIKKIEEAFDAAIKLQQHMRLAGLDAKPLDYESKPTILVE